jgi:triacylglycerol esterase/lipase EstA (alpha/beta hydrolase family)
MSLRFSLFATFLWASCAAPGSHETTALTDVTTTSQPDHMTTPQDDPGSKPEPNLTVPLNCETNVYGNLPEGVEGPFIAQGDEVSGNRKDCTSALHATAGARETAIEVTLTSWGGEGPALLSVRDLSDTPLVEATQVAPGDKIIFSLTQTGEVFLHLEPVDENEPANDYALAIRCVEGCDAEYTRYPIILFHGMGGAENFGDVEYFFRVLEVLEPMGYALYAPGVNLFSSTEARALEWMVHLDALVAEGVGRRFNIIAHSQGGLDARYLVSVLGPAERIVSLVTVGTPHYGTPVADLLLGTVDDGYVDGFWVDVGANAFAQFYGLQKDDTSLINAMASLTTQALAEFNEQVIDNENIYYASWAGVSCGALEFDCQKACGGETVDALLAATYFILWLDGIPNDGIVPVESAMWGDYRGEICADHADQVGLFGDINNQAFDHLSFYLDELRRLAQLGF